MYIQPLPWHIQLTSKNIWIRDKQGNPVALVNDIRSAEFIIRVANKSNLDSVMRQYLVNAYTQKLTEI